MYLYLYVSGICLFMYNYLLRIVFHLQESYDMRAIRINFRNDIIDAHMFNVHNNAMHIVPFHQQTLMT